MLCFTLLNWFAVICSTNGKHLSLSEVIFVIIIYVCIGAVMISPSPRASVCRVGGRLEVTCTTTQRALTWNLTIIGATNSITRTLSTTTLNQNIVLINSATLIFSRVSEVRASPLVSMLVVPAISQGLNGTRINCMERSTTAASMATTSVYIYSSGKFSILSMAEFGPIKLISCSMEH